MTADDIARIMEDDLARGRLKWSGRPLQDCMRIPHKITVGNASEGDGTEEVWLVFEESAVPGEGYKVVFDESVGLFGLAAPGLPNPVVVGLYGGFVDALQSM